jgi:protein-S-isoprenylcysteine O-methyltransferase Ste14
MALRSEMIGSGRWLFRWRSYVPLALVVVIAPAALVSPLARWNRATSIYWEIACLAIVWIGEAWRAYVVGCVSPGTSGRATREMRATRLNTTGPYSILRNPLYLGNYLMLLGCMLLLGVLWLPLIASLLFWIYYERIIMAEEEFLESSFGLDFTSYAARTPAFLARLSLWRPPEAPFSFKVALRREYPAPLWTVALFALTDTALQSFAVGRFIVAPPWSALLLASLVFYVVVRALVKLTKTLKRP